MSIPKLKQIATHISRGDTPDYVESSNIQVINQACVYPGGLDFSRVKYHNSENIEKITAWVRQSDILINSTGTGTLGRVALIREEPKFPSFADGHVTILRDDFQRFHPKFVFHYLSIQQEYLTALCSVGSTNQIELSRSKFGDLDLDLPPLHEQRQISDYLDRETAKIDALIAAKKRLLELLGEKRRSLITHAVTCGLKSDVSMRNSGVEWIGKIPRHWETPPIYARYELLLGKMLDEKKITGKNLAPYLRNVDVQWHMINTKDLPEMDFDEMDRQNYSLKSGDILICEGGESGRTAIWEGKLQQCFYQKALHRLRPISIQEDNPIFFSFMMEAAVGSGVFTAEGNRSTIQHLTAEKLRIFRFPAPPLSEQVQIVEYIQSKLRTLDSLYSVTESMIALLQERRTSLISAAVTGQFRIPD